MNVANPAHVTAPHALSGYCHLDFSPSLMELSLLLGFELWQWESHSPCEECVLHPQLAFPPRLAHTELSSVQRSYGTNQLLPKKR